MRYETAVLSSSKRGTIIPLWVAFAAVIVAGMGFSPRSTRSQAKSAKAKTVNLPYATIDHPQFVSATQATFLGPNDIVLGVTDGKTAKAYAAAILSQHGVVQDTTADGPIAITW